MKVLVLGRTEVLYDTVQLLRGEHEICGIVTAPAASEYAKGEADFEALAKELGCPFLCTRALSQPALDLIRTAGPDIAVSLNWVSVVNQEAASLFPHGILNAHYADLPSYRGNAVANWAILRGEPSLALTVHFMSPGELDSGDIVAQHRIDLSSTTTIADVLEAARKHVPRLFAETLEGLAQNALQPILQTDTGKPAFRCFPRQPVHSRIDWDRPVREIDALIRASTRPFSGAYSYMLIDGSIRKVTVWSSRVVSDTTNDVGTPGQVIHNDAATGESWVYTGAGILGLTSLQYDDEAEFAPGRAWRSIRMSFGIDVEAELVRLQQLVAELRANR